LKGREESLTKSAVMAAIKNPKLLTCKPSTVVSSLTQAAQLGFTDVSGTLGQAYLVPYKDQCQLIVGYRGMLDLARRSGEIESVTARAVFQGDQFEIEYGDNERFAHRPMAEDESPDKLLGAYVIAKFKGGGIHRTFMSRKQIEGVMVKSQSRGQYGPWKDHFIEMALKTVIRRAFKYWPMSLELQGRIQEMATDESARGVVGDLMDVPMIEADVSDVPDSPPPSLSQVAEPPKTDDAPLVDMSEFASEKSRGRKV
jgi:recombination protein RecT